MRRPRHVSRTSLLSDVPRPDAARPERTATYQFRLQVRQRCSQCHLKSRCFMQWTVAVSEADVHKWSPWTPVPEAVLGPFGAGCTKSERPPRQIEDCLLDFASKMSLT